MRMWVIHVRPHLSWILKESLCPGQRFELGPFDLNANTLSHCYKVGLYRKAVQAYDIPNLYSETYISQNP